MQRLPEALLKRSVVDEPMDWDEEVVERGYGSPVCWQCIQEREKWRIPECVYDWCGQYSEYERNSLRRIKTTQQRSSCSTGL